MILLDANILLYAHNTAAPQHGAITEWLKTTFLKEETIGLPWVTVWAFLRIRTNPRLWPNPESPAATLSILRYWFTQPGVVLVNPGSRHSELLNTLVDKHQVTGPLVTDAVLAALAIENGATLASTDQDFSRFTDLRWVNPLAAQ
jgi:uncharacterized protein